MDADPFRALVVCIDAKARNSRGHALSDSQQLHMRALGVYPPLCFAGYAAACAKAGLPRPVRLVAETPCTTSWAQKKG
jgi:hypothetical protein